jgi:hypothetical protein
MTDEVDIYQPTEMDAEGSLFDPRTIERLLTASQQGCWFWLDWDVALMCRDRPTQNSRPHC